MHKNPVVSLPLLLIVLGAMMFPGCGTHSQGIKFRAQAPAIEEAFRLLSLAVHTDGFPVENTDPAGFSLESGWRALRMNELSQADTGIGITAPEGRISLKLVKRGRLYDVLLTPRMRTGFGDAAEGVIVPPTHPLRIKWEKAITRLIEREARDED